MASSSSSHLPASALNPRRHVGVHAERVSDVSSTEFPGHYPGEDLTWKLDEFKKVRPSLFFARDECAHMRVSVVETERVSQETITTLY